MGEKLQNRGPLFREIINGRYVLSIIPEDNPNGKNDREFFEVAIFTLGKEGKLGQMLANSVFSAGGSEIIQTVGKTLANMIRNGEDPTTLIDDEEKINDITLKLIIERGKEILNG